MTKLLLTTLCLCAIAVPASARPYKLHWQLKSLEKKTDPQAAKTHGLALAALAKEANKRKTFLKSLPKWANKSPKTQTEARRLQNRLLKRRIYADTVTITITDFEAELVTTDKGKQYRVSLGLKLLGQERFTTTLSFVSNGSATVALPVDKLREADKAHTVKLAAKHAAKAAVEDAIRKLAKRKKRKKR